MRRLAFVSLLLALALNIFGHAGEVHAYMGTIAKLNGDGSFVLATTGGKTVDVTTSNKTAFLHANGTAATRAELAAGRRVAVTVSTDGRTASEVRFGAKKKK